MKRSFHRKIAGITIVELIVVITVLSLLTPVVIFSLGNYYQDNLTTITSSTQDTDVRNAIATISNDLRDARGFSTSFSVSNTTAPLGSTNGATGTGNWSYCGTGTTSITCDGVTTDNGTTNRVLIAYNDLTDGPISSEATKLLYVDNGQAFNLDTAVPGTFAYIYFVAPDRTNTSQNNLYRRTIVQVDPAAPDTYKTADSGLRATPYQKTTCASTVVATNSTVCKERDAVLLYNVKSFWIDYYDSANQKIADYYTNNATTATTVASNIKSSVDSVKVTITKQMSNLSKKISQASGIIDVNTNTSSSTSVISSPSIVTDSLVLNLDAGNASSYPGSGTTWTNLASSGSNGTLTNGPTFSNGAINFDGSDDYVAVTLNKASSCTFSVWAKTTSLATGPMLFNAGPIGTGPDLFFYSGTISWNTWDGTAASFGASPASVTNGNWHHYVVVNDSVNNNAKLYYDNALFGTTTFKNAAANTTLVIGGAPTGYMWNGSIAIFMVHNKALSSAEISQNFSAHKTRFGL